MTERQQDLNKVYFNLINRYAQKAYKNVSIEFGRSIEKICSGPYCSSVTLSMFHQMKEDKRFAEVRLLNKMDDSGEIFFHQFLLVKIGKTEYIIDPTYQQVGGAKPKNTVLIVERSKLDEKLEQLGITADMWKGAKKVVSTDKFPYEFESGFIL